MYGLFEKNVSLERNLSTSSKIETNKNRKPLTVFGEGSPLRVGGELLSHGLPQYHRRGGA